MSTALAVTTSQAIKGTTTAEREASLLTHFQNALQIAVAANDIMTRFKVAQELDALKDLAESYNVSAETVRTLSETSVRSLRLFGLALNEALPRKVSSFDPEEIGATKATCKNARYLAHYSETDLAATFDTLREQGRNIGPILVYRTLRDNSPAVQKQREEKAAEEKAKGQARINEITNDPDRLLIEEIWARHEYSYVNVCRRLLEMGRENAGLKKQLVSLMAPQAFVGQ